MENVTNNVPIQGKEARFIAGLFVSNIKTEFKTVIKLNYYKLNVYD